MQPPVVHYDCRGRCSSSRSAPVFFPWSGIHHLVTPIHLCTHPSPIPLCHWRSILVISSALSPYALTDKAQQGLCLYCLLTYRDASVNLLERFYTHPVVWETPPIPVRYVPELLGVS